MQIKEGTVAENFIKDIRRTTRKILTSAKKESLNDLNFK